MNRTILTQFWTDPRVRTLPPEGKLLFVYCITSPHSHVSGIYYLPELVVAQQTGIANLSQCTPDTVSGSGISWWELLRVQNLVKRDHVNEVVWVVNMLRHQSYGGAKNSKLTTAVKKQMGTLHNSYLIEEMHRYYNLPFALDEIGYKRNHCIENQCTPDTVSEVGKSCSPILVSKYLSISSAVPMIGISPEPPASNAPNTASPSPDKPAKKKSKKTDPKQPKARDLIWDAVVAVTGADSVVSASHIGKVVSLLKKAEPPYTPEEILRLPEAIRLEGMSFTITVGAIEKHIGLVRKHAKPPERPKLINRHEDENRQIADPKRLSELIRNQKGGEQ